MALVRDRTPATRRGGSSARRGEAGRARGLGDSAITVKGTRAIAKQRATIQGCLSQARDDGASRRVMIAVVMAITQESDAGKLLQTTGDDDTGIFQQGRNWITAEGARQPGPSTHAFLVTGPTSWKKVHGGLKHAPGDLSTAIARVQQPRRDLWGAYGQWEQEATRTVDTWLGSDDALTDDGGGTYRKRYEFTRGQRGGESENSWDAIARLVGEVGARRWAAGNVLYAVSDTELRAGAPSLTLRGDEAWLLHAPAFSWASSRDISEVTLEVLADRWTVMPGGVIVLDQDLGPIAGRWLVWQTSGQRLDSPVISVTLRRPTRLRREPPAETASRSDDTSTGAGSLRDEAKRISDHAGAYLLGGGHGPKLSTINSSARLDCSSSCSLALHRAGMFTGDVAIVSGRAAGSPNFEQDWGKPGKGDEFTIWANGNHVWIEGYDDDGGFAWRFDTSQHPGPSGPRLVTTPRHDQARFTARHWSGR